MGYRINETYHIDREAADEVQKSCSLPGYNETYPKGVFPCKVIHPETGEAVDGWKSVTETYYG